MSTNISTHGLKTSDESNCPMINCIIKTADGNHPTTMPSL